MGAPEGEKSRWQVWALSCAQAAFYRILESRSAEAARHVLSGYSGTVMADGYGAYESLRKNGGQFRLAHCWAHVRRKFIEAETAFPRQAAEAVALIGELYHVEASCPTGPPGDEERRRLRGEKSRDITRRIHEWALVQRVLRESSVGRAISYMGGLWPGLVLFLEDPSIPLDNNSTERALRGVVVGRKNHYGSRSRRGTEVAALFYSLTETSKLVGLEPREYLRRAVRAAVAGEQVPLPHEIAASAQA